MGLIDSMRIAISSHKLKNGDDIVDDLSGFPFAEECLRLNPFRFFLKQ